MKDNFFKKNQGTKIRQDSGIKKIILCDMLPSSQTG